MLNTVAINGRLAADPALRSTKDGTPVCSFSVAVNRDKGDQADFFDIVAWKGTAEFVFRNFSKGSSIIIKGRLQSRTYEKDGQKRKAIEIVAESVYFAGGKKTETAEMVPVDDDGELPF